MAEKKTVRWGDYINRQESEESTSKKKTVAWGDYLKTSGNNGSETKAYVDWRDYLDKGELVGAVGEHITGRINTWADNLDDFLTDYQNRFSGRKYNYEDAYVSDSASYLDTVSKQSAEYKQEYNDIIAYLDQNSKYLNPEWVKKIEDSLASSVGAYDEIVKIATKDNDYWNTFTPNEEQSSAGYTAEKVYNEWQEGQKQYTASKALDIDAAKLELEDLKKEKTAYFEEQAKKREEKEKNKPWWEKLAGYIGEIQDTTLPLAGVNQASGATYYNPYDKLIAEKERYIKDAQEIQTYERYMALMGNADFSELSGYVKQPCAERSNMNNYSDEASGWDDPLYEAINGNTEAQAWLQSAGSYRYSSGGSNPLGSLFGQVAAGKTEAQHMTDEEVAVYNYLYKKEGKESAREYYSFLQNALWIRERAADEEYWKKQASESPVMNSLFSVIISPLKVLSAAGQVADYIVDGKVNENASYNRYSHVSSAIREQVASDIAKSGKWGDVGSWTYQLGMSMGDFLMNSAVSGGSSALSLTLMGSGAMADTVIAAKDRGLSDDQAMVLGVVAGAAEVITEKFSLDALFKGDMTKGAMKYILTNALTEGTEEVGSSLINLYADILVSKDKSEWATAIEEYKANHPNASESEAFQSVLTDTALSLGLDFLGGALSGTAMGGGTYAGTSAVAGFQYGDIGKNKAQAQKLVAEGLELNPTSKYVQKAQNKVEKGKNLTGMQVRNILTANQEQITANDMKKIRQAAEKRLTELGQTENVSEVAEIATKWATGQEITRAQKRVLTHSQYGSRVANELLPENIASENYSTDWAEEIGTESVNKTAYNKKAIRTLIDAMANAEDPATYKSLGERAGTESTFKVSKSGQATIRDEAIDLRKAEVVDFVKDKKGNIVDMTVKVDGKEVKASEIDYADGDQSYLFEAVSKIENITPKDATVIVRDYDPSSGQSVGEYLNGIDEGFTYGYYGYSETDLKAGNFAPKLTDTQMKTAYELGKAAKKDSNEIKAEAFKRMRTAVEVEAEKAAAEGKEAPKAKNLTVTYDRGNGDVVSIDKAGIRDAKRSGAVEVAKILHKMGLGTKVEFFSSYLSKTLKDEEGNAVRVFLDENGAEKAAPSGVYRKGDGMIRVDLNAYNGRGLTLNVLAHEMTHFIQQWSEAKYKVLADFLIKAYEKTDMTMHERVLREQARLEGIRGESVSYDEAFDEVVANAMSKMFDDGKLVERLTELKAQDEKLARKLWEGFKKILAKFLGIYKEAGTLFQDTADLMAMKETFEQLQNMFAESLAEASENYQAALTVAESQTLAESSKEAGTQQSSQETDFEKDFDYSDLNWATDLGIITAKDKAVFERTINNEIFRGAEPQSANGEYIIDTGRCLMFTDGDFHNPTLTRVIVFATEYESLTADAKEMIFDEAKATGEIQASLSVVEKMFGQGFVSLYDRPNGRTYAGQNRGRKGSNRSRTAQTARAKSLKERLAEEGLSHLLEDDEVYSSQETDVDRAYDEGFKDYDVVSAVYTIRNEKAKRGHDLVEIGNMPTLYRKLFGLSGNVYVSNTHLYQNMVSRATAETEGRFDPEASADYHELGEEKVINAIEQFQDPLVIMESLKDFNEPRLVAILDEKGNDGENLIAVLELYAPLRPHGVSQLRNHVLITIYEKNSLPDYIEETADKNRVLYKKEGSRLTSQAGLQLAGEMSKETLKKNVARFNKKVKAFKEENKINYSEHDTDYSNRELLANAFEGISQNSVEYAKLQEYKDNIKVLNLLEDQLAELNAQIREIRFTKGKYDAKKLQTLEEKAERIAKDINKQDKILLNMEASEPLRKVIEYERKKASQKTKEHIKEIQQNKKLKAEQTELRHKIRKTVRDLNKLLNRGNKKTNVKEDMKDFVSQALELADYLFTDHISNDELIRKGITVRMSPEEATLVKETEDILSKLYDNADSLTDDEFTRLDAKRKANEEKLKDLLTAQRNERLNTPVAKLFDDLVKSYASLKNSNQDAVKAAYSEELENSLRAFMGDADRVKILENMRVADMTTEELNWLYRAYTMVLTNVRNANKLFVKGKQESIEQTVSAIMADFAQRKAPDGKAAIVARNIANKIGWDYEKLYYALDRIGSEAFTELIMNLANSENIVMQDVMEAAAYRDQIVEKYGFNNWDVNKKIDKEFLDNNGKKFQLTLGQLMSLYAYSRRKGAWDHIEYGGFVFGEKALTNPRPADSYKLSQAQCEAITNTLTKEQKGYVEEMQKFLSETMGEKGNEVSMMLYGIKMFGEKNYFPIHIAGQYKAQANEAQAKAAAGFSSMTNAGFTHEQNPNAKAPFVLEGFNEVWSDHVNEMSRYHGSVPAMEDLRRVMNRSSYSDAYAESMSVTAMMENAFGQEAVEYFNNLYREANSGAITDKLQKKSKKLLSLFRKNSVAYSLSVLVQQPASMVRAYAIIDKKYFGFKGVGALTSGIAKAVSNKWTKAHANAYNEMLKYAPGVTMAKEIGGFDTATGGSIRSYLLDTNKSLKQKLKTENAVGKGKAVLDVVDNNAVANLPSVADKIAWIEIWNACKRETVAKHKDLATNSEEFMQIVGDRFTEVIRATQVYDSIFAKSPMLKSKNLAVQYLVSFMNEPNTTANMVEKAVRDFTKGNWKKGAKTAAVVVHSIIFTNVLKSIIYAMRDDDEDETYIEKYIEAITGGMMDDLNALNYIPLVRDAWSIAQGYDVERADMAIVADAIDAFENVIKYATTDTSEMTEEQLIEFDKKQTEASWKLAESLASFVGIPVKNIRREVEGVIDHARIASANVGMTTASSLWDKVTEEVLGSIPGMSSKEAKTDKLYDAIISGDDTYLERLKSTYKTEDAYQSAVRKALRENDTRIHEAALARYSGNIEEYKRIFREIHKEGKFSFDDIMSAVNSEVTAIKNKLEPDKATSQYSAGDFVEAVVMGNATEAQAMRDDIIATKVANGKTQEKAEKEFSSNVATDIGKACSSGLLDKAGAEKLLMEHADMDEEEAASRVGYWDFCEEHPEYEQYNLSESNVNKYLEFAEPADISMEVFVQFRDGIKGLEPIKDKWGDVEKSVRDQTLEVIHSLPLTRKQKDALYLVAGYPESKIWDVPW